MTGQKHKFTLTKEHYDTVSVAIEVLRKMGFTADFNFKDNCLFDAQGKIKADAI